MPHDDSAERLPRYDELPAAAGGARSGWGLFGEDDSAGLMNLLTPARVAAAATEVRTGEVFALGAPLDAIEPPMFRRGSPRHTVIVSPTGSGHDDLMDNFYPQASSQWDSLAHVGFDRDVFYNGATAEDIQVRGRNTIDHWARRGIVGRAVLLDVAAVLADAGETVDPGASRAITVDELEAARQRAGVEFQPGDILLLHTGFLAWYLGRTPAEKRTLATATTSIGIAHDEDMARYLWDSHACAIAADNPALEVWPPDGDQAAWPFGFLHRLILGQFGMAIGELWWLHDLAASCRADGRYTALLTSAPLNVPGGIGSPPNAVAIK
jgi:kynurenine formamidase